MLHWRRCARRIRLALIHRHGPRCQYGRSAAAPLHVVVPRSTCNVQPSTPRASSPRHGPAAVTGAAPLRPYVALPPSRLSPLAPLTSCLLPLSPLASRPLTVRCNVATGDVQPSNLQPLAPHPLSPLASRVIVLRSLQRIGNRYPPGSQFGDNRCYQGVEVRQHRFREVQPWFQDQRFHSPQDNARRRLPA